MAALGAVQSLLPGGSDELMYQPSASPRVKKSGNRRGSIMFPKVIPKAKDSRPGLSSSRRNSRHNSAHQIKYLASGTDTENEADDRLPLSSARNSARQPSAPLSYRSRPSEGSSTLPSEGRPSVPLTLKEPKADKFHDRVTPIGEMPFFADKLPRDTSSLSDNFKMSDSVSMKFRKRSALTERRILLRMKLLGDLQLMVALFGIAVMIIIKEMKWSSHDIAYDSWAIKGLKGIVTFSSMILVVFIHVYYKTRVSLLALKKLIPQNASILTSGLQQRYFVELVVCFTHCPPSLSIASGYNWENLLSVLMFCRIYLVARYLSLHSVLFTSAGRFIGCLTNVDASTTLVLKMSLANHPHRVMSLAFVMLLSIASYSVFVFERTAAFEYMETTQADNVDERHNSMMYYGNVLWMMFITVLTVGYGDLFPYTPEGRVCTIIAAALGACCTALLIALIHNQLELSQQETKLVRFLQKDWVRKMVKLKACRCIQAGWRYHMVRQRAQQRKLTQSLATRWAELQLYKELQDWRNIKKVMSRLGGQDSQRQVTVIEAIHGDLRDLIMRLESGGIILANSEDEEEEDEQDPVLPNLSFKKLAGPSASVSVKAASVSLKASALPTTTTTSTSMVEHFSSSLPGTVESTAGLSPSTTGQPNSITGMPQQLPPMTSAPSTSATNARKGTLSHSKSWHPIVPSSANITPSSADSSWTTPALSPTSTLVPSFAARLAALTEEVRELRNMSNGSRIASEEHMRKLDEFMAAFAAANTVATRVTSATSCRMPSPARSNIVLPTTELEGSMDFAQSGKWKLVERTKAGPSLNALSIDGLSPDGQPP
mmetsp:Transcript_10390/g.16963  ORF Transcript_10390/g.16963 Transcript_10390/m.16963 type:complete len:828 (+) Transcript_10390:65-2548(+)|eukprot:CAMPEP_0184366452 /NCGR_PEP_ID=MMETSP1089-20130417/153948_1 /TAXON_ID=38269 ORGANISM="Gloeochaete wittrockiana, Strain SAG46.84" /NCGR_SAMPLE_ID=MMETSP1089 /ASSEMBLY_ACC=CAM_ASM_000445 /LENGTH=827 /DNA_ID=CAMNT_0026708049 /DNA_START=69 /DNA_END=2552 /DNA_ORIENTATION=+